MEVYYRGLAAPPELGFFAPGQFGHGEDDGVALRAIRPRRRAKRDAETDDSRVPKPSIMKRCSITQKAVPSLWARPGPLPPPTHRAMIPSKEEGESWRNQREASVQVSSIIQL